jgi:hypothetical protein
MIDATVEPVKPDLNAAQAKLLQAMNHARSAERCVDNESAYILLYSAVHKALAAVLLSVGLRVSSGERAHVKLIEEAKKHFGPEHAQLLARVDRARRKRNDVSYETAQIADAVLTAMKVDTKTTLEAALRFVREQKSSHASA